MRTKECFEHIEVYMIDRVYIFLFHFGRSHPTSVYSLVNRIEFFIFELPRRNKNRYIILSEVFVCRDSRTNLREIRGNKGKAEFFLDFTNGRCFGNFISFGTTSEKSPFDRIFRNIAPILDENRGIISIEDHDAHRSKKHITRDE